MIRIASLLGIVLVTSVACSESSTEPENESGSLSFTYSGSGLAGSVSAEGPLPSFSGGSPEPDATAFAGLNLPTGETASGAVLRFPVSVLAIQPTGDFGHFALLILPRLDTGEFTITPGCLETTGCAGGLIELDQVGGDIELISGTIRVTGTGGNRIRGTFSGVAETQDIVPRRITISNGQFDVPVYTEAQLRARGAVFE